MKKTGTRRLQIRGRGLLVASLATLIASGALAQVQARETAGMNGTVHVGTLGVGGELFWDGAYIEDSLGVPSREDVCSAPTLSCFEYTFDIVESGERLRIALDDPRITEIIEYSLFDPDGVRALAPANGAWTSERFVARPKLGTWTARVVAASAEDATFRMRAKLEGTGPAASGKKERVRDLLPNLRLTPPWEFTFEAPATLLGPSVAAREARPVSCTVGETANGQPVRCLRFGLGPQNAGEGPLELLYQPSEDPTASVPITQTVYRSDGTHRERTAGVAQYHLQHAHYHHVGFGTLELYRVTDEKKGTLVLAGAGPKQGYCIASILVIDWSSFTQDKRRQSTCEERGQDNPVEGAEMHLAAGWSDVYGWDLDFNYVEFGTNPDGLYVVRSTTDPDNQVLESNEWDNTGYALIDVRGNDITVLERGYGESPWDRHKLLADPGLLYMKADTHWVPFSDVT